MTKSVEQEQQVRAKFYADPAVIRYIKIHGTPKSKQEFREMVGSGSTQQLDGKEGLELIACLGEVVFRKHTQQINVMDKSNGKTIVSLPR
jgi:hypothetical protein